MPSRSLPCYSLRLVPNWSRTKSITLWGCDLASAFGDHDNHSNGLACLGSLERLTLSKVNLSEQLLHAGFLDNAPRLVELELWSVYGIDRLEVVSSPRLQSLRLCGIYRSKNDCEKMRSLRISSPKLEKLWMPSGLEELEIDAPDLVSFSWTVYPSDSFTKVNLLNLSSTCRSTIRGFSLDKEFSPQWLRMSLSSTAFNQLQCLNLVFSYCIYFARRQVWFDLSQVEYGSVPRAIDEVRFEATAMYLPNIDLAARFLEILFSICHPKFMSINVYQEEDPDQPLVQYMCDEYMMTGSPDGVTIVASWRRHLKDMKIEDEITGDMMDISEDLISSLANRKTIHFMLTWC
ncbi:unnamed protein product [Linum trigynum]|uniref:Uncharacterized protein n=1 Tax=Linum trigynum TaxID=586398 RepID=A0AAV2FIL2_9ROSI